MSIDKSSSGLIAFRILVLNSSTVKFSYLYAFVLSVLLTRRFCRMLGATVDLRKLVSSRSWSWFNVSSKCRFDKLKGPPCDLQASSVLSVLSVFLFLTCSFLKIANLLQIPTLSINLLSISFAFFTSFELRAHF